MAPEFTKAEKNSFMDDKVKEILDIHFDEDNDLSATHSHEELSAAIVHLSETCAAKDDIIAEEQSKVAALEARVKKLEKTRERDGKLSSRAARLEKSKATQRALQARRKKFLPRQSASPQPKSQQNQPAGREPLERSESEIFDDTLGSVVAAARETSTYLRPYMSPSPSRI